MMTDNCTTTVFSSQSLKDERQSKMYHVAMYDSSGDSKLSKVFPLVEQNLSGQI